MEGWLNLLYTQLIPYKIGIKRRNTIDCLDQYACRGLGLWNSRDCEAVYVYKYMQLGPRTRLGTRVSMVAIWWLCASSSSETGNFNF